MPPLMVWFLEIVPPLFLLSFFIPNKFVKSLLLTVLSSITSYVVTIFGIAYACDIWLIPLFSFCGDMGMFIQMAIWPPAVSGCVFVVGIVRSIRIFNKHYQIKKRNS
jgi:hypothetical protein